MLADAMQRDLEKAGALVLGPIPSVTEALDLIEAGPPIDAAVLDTNLDGERVFPVAKRLQARGVPFLFVTGYDISDLPAEWRHITRCEKPVNMELVMRALLSGMAQR